MVFAKGRPCAGCSGKRADRESTVDVGGVPEKQTENLAAGISAGTGHGHRSHRMILHVYAAGCKLINQGGCEPDVDVTSAALFGSDAFGGKCDGAVARSARLVLGQGPIRRPEGERQRQRLAALTDLRAHVHVEEPDVL